MVSTDPIADMLTRIRNAILVNRNVVSVPHSKLKATVAKQLADSNFVSGVKETEENGLKSLIITINELGSNPNITHVERMSKPGRRLYSKATEIPVIKNGRGIVIISTSQGIMTGNQANDKQLGGELLCKVY